MKHLQRLTVPTDSPVRMATPLPQLLRSRELLKATLTPETISRIASQVPDEISLLLASSLQRNEFLTEDVLDPLLSYCILKENADSFCSYLDVSQGSRRTNHEPLE